MLVVFFNGLYLFVTHFKNCSELVYCIWLYSIIFAIIGYIQTGSPFSDLMWVFWERSPTIGTSQKGLQTGPFNHFIYIWLSGVIQLGGLVLAL